MSNPDREQQIEVGDRKLTLIFGNRALRLAEKQGAKAFGKFDFESISDVSTLIWAGLQAKHPEISLDDVDDIIDEVGYAGLTEMAAQAIERAFPAAEGDSGNGNRAQRRAPAGVGTASSNKA